VPVIQNAALGGHVMVEREPLRLTTGVLVRIDSQLPVVDQIGARFMAAARGVPDFMDLLDVVSPWTCARVDLIDCVLEAPRAYLRGWLLAIHDCRLNWASARGGFDAQGGVDSGRRSKLAAVACRLEESLGACLDWAFQLECTELNTCDRVEVEALFSSAPEQQWQGYLAGIIEWRAMVDPVNTSRLLAN
jgi:hypothetical protein